MKVIVIALLLSACAAPPPPQPIPVAAPDPQPVYVSPSTRLKDGMTESQVVGIFERQPQRVNMGTCGGAPNVPTWSCKTYFYDLDHTAIYFRRDKDSWIVNNWHTW